MLLATVSHLPSATPHIEIADAAEIEDSSEKEDDPEPVEQDAFSQFMRSIPDPSETPEASQPLIDKQIQKEREINALKLELQ